MQPRCSQQENGDIMVAVPLKSVVASALSSRQKHAKQYTLDIVSYMYAAKDKKNLRCWFDGIILHWQFIVYILSQKVVVVDAFLFFVHGKHIRSCRHGQLT